MSVWMDGSMGKCHTLCKHHNLKTAVDELLKGGLIVISWKICIS